MPGYSGNFYDVWDNGYKYTAQAESLNVSLGYAANKALPANVGFEQYLAGQFQPKLSLTGFLDTTNTAGRLHKYWGDTYNDSVGAADDIEHIVAVVVGYDATPAQSNPVIPFVGTLTSYDPQTATDGVAKYQAEFMPRGVHFALCDAVLVGSGATVTTSTTSSAYDRGAAYATGQTAGGFAMIQWAGSGSSDVTAVVQTATSGGGSYATVATLAMTGVTNGAAYVVIPSTTTINRYVKVNWTLSSSPQTADYVIALGFFNP